MRSACSVPKVSRSSTTSLLWSGCRSLTHSASTGRRPPVDAPAPITDDVRTEVGELEAVAASREMCCPTNGSISDAGTAWRRRSVDGWTRRTTFDANHGSASPQPQRIPGAERDGAEVERAPSAGAQPQRDVAPLAPEVDDLDARGQHRGDVHGRAPPSMTSSTSSPSTARRRPACAWRSASVAIRRASPMARYKPKGAARMAGSGRPVARAAHRPTTTRKAYPPSGTSVASSRVIGRGRGRHGVERPRPRRRRPDAAHPVLGPQHEAMAEGGDRDAFTSSGSDEVAARRARLAPGAA